MTRRTRRLGPQDSDPHGSDPSADSMHPGSRTQDRTQGSRPTWGPAYLEERARRAWAQAHGWSAPLPDTPTPGVVRPASAPPPAEPVNLGPDVAYGVEQQAWTQREQETREARLRAASIRARAEARKREIWAAMDTGPLVLLWPHPTPEPMAALSGPEAILLAHPDAPGEPSMRFRIGERVAYTYASTRRWGVVEGARRFSTGWKYAVRWLCMNPHTHRLTWTRDVREVWEGYLRSMETRVLPRKAPATVKLLPPMPPPAEPSKP